MPVVIRHKGYKFFFFSNEGHPREPLHIHIRKGSSRAKIWLEPQVFVASSYQMTGKELRELMKVVEENRSLIKRSWDEYFED